MDIKELKKLKRAAKMTNIEISDLSGIPVSTVNKIFSGATENPRYATLLAIEQVLREKQKLPFRYDEYREEPSLIQEQVAYYRYNSRKYSLEDIEKLDEVSGYELIDGMLYLKGAPTRMHEFLIMKISFAFQKHIYEKKGNCHVYVSKLGVSLFKDDKTWVAPDITVVCQRDKLTHEGCNGAPELVVEIVSPSNSSYDYLTKMIKYQNAGVREYWIVDPELRIVSVYYFDDHSKSGRYQYEDTITSNVLEGLEIRISDFIEEY